MVTSSPMSGTNKVVSLIFRDAVRMSDLEYV